MGIVNTVFSFEKNSSIVFNTLLLALSGGILSGIYPAFFATSYTGELAMRGNFNLSSSGMKIKKALLCVQYAISCSLILFIAAIYLQNRMMLQFDPKFEKDRIAIVGLTSDIVKNKGAWIKEELQKYPEIENVAFTSERFGAQDTYCTEGIEYNGTDIPSFLIYVTPDFPEVMGIKMTEGKTFPKTSKGDIIVNRYMKENYGVELGNIPSMEAEAIGICDNINFTSMRKSQSAVCFVSLPAESGYLSDMFVRLASGYDRTAAVSHIKKIISKVEPEYPTEVLFYDNVAATQYQRESSFANTMLCFSIIAIVLSLVGVFSMVIFDIQHKRKEIAIRKVFGAEYTDVLWLGNKPYFFIVLAGFIISIPVAVIAINEYLQGFAMKVNVSWWIFLLVFMFIQILTAILVVLRYNSIALESPNTSLETE
ncbi:FtsX-like permease family protein [uncultured Bacteroides sp.]|uniref:ABC transporter permease n=1 Tax=uncultured Bacteroides sp. TaxID=162156 RepID=UPI00261D60B4|nr:FtsX-like permease family protein [uncultured Bacteroides sp.]